MKRLQRKNSFNRHRSVPTSSPNHLKKPSHIKCLQIKSVIDRQNSETAEREKKIHQELIGLFVVINWLIAVMVSCE